MIFHSQLLPALVAHLHALLLVQAHHLLALVVCLSDIWNYQINPRFKLPRNQFNFVGIRNTVSNFVNESLPNITATGGSRVNTNTITGAYYVGTYSNMYGGAWTTSNDSLCFDASLSSSTYQDNAPVQQKAIQVYLNFYIN